MGEQEGRVEELKERIEQKQREFARLAEVEEDNLVPAKAHPKRDAAVRFNPGPDNISQVEERRLSAGSQEGEMLSCRTPAELQYRAEGRTGAGFGAPRKIPS